MYDIVGNTSHVRTISQYHTIKIVDYGLAYNIWWVILILPYDFGKERNSTSIYATQYSLRMGLWTQAHEGPMGAYTCVDLGGDYMTNCHDLT